MLLLICVLSDNFFLRLLFSLMFIRFCPNWMGKMETQMYLHVLMVTTSIRGLPTFSQNILLIVNYIHCLSLCDLRKVSALKFPYVSSHQRHLQTATISPLSLNCNLTLGWNISHYIVTENYIYYSHPQFFCMA